MKKVHSLAFAALTLPLILAACGSATSTPAASSEMVSLTLNSGLTVALPQALQAQGLKPLGLPSTGTASAVTYIKVNVKDSNGNPVSFDGNNVYKVGGAQSFITLSNTNPTTKLLLPKGTYSFESVGKDNQNGTFLAYGQDNGKDLSALNPSVNLGLHTLMSQANSTLTSKLPVNFVNTTDKLDLRLAVRTPGMALNVPTSDYTVAYSSNEVSVLNSSQLGANVQVNGTTSQSSVGVTATVTGWVDNGNETASLLSRPVSYTVPLSVTGLGTDATPPAVTMNAVGTATNTIMSLSGTASDDKGVQSVKVYDGSMLIGSTDSADNVTLISFSGSNWSFGWTSGATAPELQVFVTDTAGNQTTAKPSTGPQVQVYTAPSGTIYEYYAALITLQPGETQVLQSDFSQNPGNTYFYQGLMAKGYRDGGSYDNLQDILSFSVEDAITGAPVSISGSYGWWIFRFSSNGQGLKWTVKNVQNTPISFYFRYYIE